jgi:hypothetical protein
MGTAFPLGSSTLVLAVKLSPPTTHDWAVSVRLLTPASSATSAPPPSATSRATNATALKTWRIPFTDYRRPLKTFKSSFRAAIGLYFLQGSFT